MNNTPENNVSAYQPYNPSWAKDDRLPVVIPCSENDKRYLFFDPKNSSWYRYVRYCHVKVVPVTTINKQLPNRSKIVIMGRDLESITPKRYVTFVNF